MKISTSFQLNSHLKPTYRQRIIDHWVLWFEAVNRYSIVDDNFVTLLDTYLSAADLEAFVLSLKHAFDFDRDTSLALESKITHYLNEVNTKDELPTRKKVHPKLVKPYISATYKAFNITFQVNADSQKLLRLVSPSLEHLFIDAPVGKIKAKFQISEQDAQLHLFLNGDLIDSFPNGSYHLLQGRFNVLLLGVLHQVEDSNWLASFHASTIAKNGKALMLAGASGSGKSTLAALLAFHGFDFVADDLTGMLYDNLHVYSYPSAISLKSGAFKTLQLSIPKLEGIPFAKNHPKGKVKFLPVPHLVSMHYPCHQVVLVKYSQHPITAKLEPIPPIKALELLIPETWISPKAAHAKAFLEWLPKLKAFELHYHQTIDGLEIIDQLLKN